MSNNEQFNSFSKKEDTVPIGSLNILSAKFEVSSYLNVDIILYIIIYIYHLNILLVQVVYYGEKLVC